MEEMPNEAGKYPQLMELPWREEAFKAQDAVERRDEQGRWVRRFDPQRTLGPKESIVKGGWDHEHRAICMATISEMPGDENLAFTDGKRWLCPNCYEEHIQK